MNKINDDISKNIKKYRKLNKMTQKRLGELVGVSTAAVSNWETGSNSIDIDSLFKVCNALNVPLSSITDSTEDFSISALERELIESFRVAKVWQRQAIVQILDNGDLPQHLAEYLDLMRKADKENENTNVKIEQLKTGGILLS